MTKRQWIFPALSCIPLTMLLVPQYIKAGVFFYVCWFIRILFLKHKETLFATLFVGLLFSGFLIYHHLTNTTILSDRQTNFIVYPKATSIQVDGDRLRFEGTVAEGDSREELVVSYRLESEEEKRMWESDSSSGQFLMIEGTLKEPAAHTNFFQFNYQSYLKRQKIHWQLQAKNIQPFQSEFLTKPRYSKIEKIRSNLFNYIDDTFEPKIGSYLKILFFADKRDISEAALQNYRSIGVVHLFSISGFHVTYLAHLIRKLFLRMGITHERTNMLLLFILPFYGSLAGFGVSVFRAICQTILLTIGKINNIQITPFNAWALTLMIALFINPYQSFEISFQLSYLLSAMFIVIGNLEWLKELHPMIQTVLFSLMSSIVSLPILSYHFFEVSWITLFANMLFIPFFTSVLFPALLILMGTSLMMSKHVIFVSLNIALSAIIETVEGLLALLTESFNFSFVIGRLPYFVMGLLIWSIFQFFKAMEARKRPTLLSVCLFLSSLFYYHISPEGYVLMLDVGQGDSFLIKEPYTGRVTMIDTGGRAEWSAKEPWQLQHSSYTIGENVIVPSLKALGISSIDRLYLTHADVDHSGEIKNIGQHLWIKEIVSTKETMNEESVFNQLKTLDHTKLLTTQPPILTNFPTENTLLIHPIRNSDSKNNHSLTLYVKMGQDGWLFTGDLEEEAERELMSTYPNLKTDFLKVGHHGSSTSTSQLFLNQIQAKYAFISAGENNPFGHPSGEVVERIEKMNIQIFNTAENGAVMVKYIKLPFIDYWLSDIQTVYKN